MSGFMNLIGLGLIDVFEIDYRGQKIVERADSTNLAEFIENIQENLDYDEELVIRRKQMSLEDFNNITEFDGF